MSDEIKAEWVFRTITKDEADKIRAEYANAQKLSVVTVDQEKMAERWPVLTAEYLKKMNGDVK